MKWTFSLGQSTAAGLQAGLQTGVDLVLSSRAGAHQLLAPGQPAGQDPAALIRHPYRLKLALPRQARQRPSVELVGLGSRAPGMPVSSRLTTSCAAHDGLLS